MPAGVLMLRRLVRRLSLRARLTLIAALAVALAVAAVSATAFLVVRAELRDQVDASLVQQSQRLQAELLAGRPGSLERALNDPVADSGRVRLQPLFTSVALVDAAGVIRDVPLAGTSSVLREAGDLRRVAQGEVSQVLRDGRLEDGTRVRALALPAFDATTGTRYALVLTRSLAETDETLSRLSVLLALVGGLGVLLAAGGGLVVARAGLRPVDRLTAAAEHVARTEDLDVPIAVTGDDEVARLARSFNAMTAALSASRQRQRQLVADAGHELRTPLTSLRTNLDLLVRAERSGRELPEEDRRHLLDDLGAQVAELSSLVGELVDLARDEHTEEQPQEVDLADVVGRALSRVRLRAGDVTVLASLQSWPVLARPAALERAVLNLLDNAVKFSPPGGAVEVVLAGGEVTVADRGPGIDPVDQPHVFERFYRSAASRGQPGSGLGLAIVAQTAAQHVGEVRLEGRAGGGTTARLRLPAAVPLLAPAGAAGSTRVPGATAQTRG